MKSIIKKIITIGVMTTFVVMTARAVRCYVDYTYTCHAARSGCNGSFSGGACFLCNCLNPDGNLIGKCWYADTAGTYTRAARAETSGLDNICYKTITCTYTHTVWDCSGTTSSTTETDGAPFETSYACGNSCK